MCLRVRLQMYLSVGIKLECSRPCRLDNLNIFHLLQASQVLTVHGIHGKIYCPKLIDSLNNLPARSFRKFQKFK